MTMVRRYPPQPPPQLHPSPGPYNNPSPAPSHASLLRGPAGSEGRSLAPHLMPQQYAHPLSRHNSYNSSSESGEPAKPPEHMLRRKTPNGILAAAYDGTSVEHTDKPHATKHILLPVTAESNIAYGIKQELPMRSPADNRQEGPSDWSPSLYFETGSGRAPQHLPQIDSMLNQIPPLQPLLPYQMYAQQPYGAIMGPPGHSPFAPTVSNDLGPYGPYWPDGTYSPYQPAAMRDPRFLHHHQHHWVHPQHSSFTGHPYNGTVPNFSNFQTPLQFNQAPQAYNNYARPTLEFSSYGPSNQNFALDYQSPSLPPPRTQRPKEYFPSGQTTPIAEHSPGTTPFSEFGPQSINGQSREKVFAWAHTVYVELLRYLQQTRKPHSHHANGRATSRPHIYPKPPRQPAADLSQPSSGRNPPPLERRSSHSSQDTVRRPSLSHSRSSSAWSASGLDPTSQRQSWQYMPQQHPMLPQLSGMEPVRTLRRISGSVANVHGQSLRHETPPSMTAASALEAITKHCEESQWKWIDGILLGGCFAYALGDYQKAQDWYKHILALENE
jgi:hypothetical protein